MKYMDINYNEVISFKRLKEVLQEKNIKIKDLALTLNKSATAISGIIQGKSTPKTDFIAKLCFVLKVPASDICIFKGIEISDYFKDKVLLYKPNEDSVGEVTYRPLRRYIEEAIENNIYNTADDLYDNIDSARRRNASFDYTKKGVKAMLEARGIKGDYTLKITRNRRDYSKGLPYDTRTKLRQDRPLNIRNIYDICKYLGCNIDYVMSYK